MVCNMQGYIFRKIHQELNAYLDEFPVVALLGPRQCGKTTLAAEYTSGFDNTVYLDLETPSDLRKLHDPELFFRLHRDKLVCLDEIQHKPEIFPVLRSIVDQHRRNGQLLILGSASRDLIKQSSESLAGRIAYLELTPFLYTEIWSMESEVVKIWSRGGFPRSFLAKSDQSSVRWRANFIRTFLERDIPQLGFNLPAATLGRLWRMLAHNQGQVLNSSNLGRALGVSHTTIRSYLDLLEQTFMLRILRPYQANIQKRLVKSPKIYIRDSGILHALLDIETSADLLGHPVYGASWEGFVIEQVLAEFPDWQPWFYRTAAGAALDLLLTKGQRRIAVECKASTAPTVSKGFWNAVEDLQIEHAWILAPVKDAYPLAEHVSVAPLHAVPTFTASRSAQSRPSSRDAGTYGA